jgi:hypothetical protein
MIMKTPLAVAVTVTEQLPESMVQEFGEKAALPSELDHPAGITHGP